MDYIKTDKEYMINWLKSNLDEKRYEHSLGTAQKAEELAEKYNLDKEKAYLAGLLHDCAKCFPHEKLIEIIDTNLDDVSEDEKASYKTLHAPVSAYVAQNVFGLSDKEILSSIRWHTIGKIQMTDFEKIIFLADKIEYRTREEEYRIKIEPFLEEENGLNKALFECYKETIKSLCQRNLRICSLTIDIYNKLLQILNVN